jgi:hypothetical protein
MRHCVFGLRRSIVAFALVPALLGCGGPTTPPAEHEEPAHVEAIAGDETRHRITLTERAAERLGIEVAQAAAAPGSGGSIWVPYSAVIYDAQGSAWAYVAEGPLVFVREAVTVTDVTPNDAGGLAVLSQGPAPGTSVVTVGVAELFGTEFEVGH